MSERDHIMKQEARDLEAKIVLSITHLYGNVNSIRITLILLNLASSMTSPSSISSYFLKPASPP